jgi:hypothetical protein
MAKAALHIAILAIAVTLSSAREDRQAVVERLLLDSQDSFTKNLHLYPVCTPDLKGKVCKKDDGCPSNCREKGQHCETIREERCTKYSKQSCQGNSCRWIAFKSWL